MDRRAHANKARQRIDCAQALITSGAAAASILFEVIQEPPHDLRGEIFDRHPIDAASATSTGERQQQGQGVAIAGLSVP
jgi:hypothetical protein